MASKLREIADALAVSLAAETWSITSTTVERKNWVQVEPEQMQNPVVYVVPGGSEVTRIGRTNWQSDDSITIYVGRHVSSDAEIDDMHDLADELMVYIRSTDLDTVSTTPQTVEIEINPDDALTERNVWRAVIQATYRTLSTD
jgi:hypothetical protein